jgi:phospholipase C
VRRIVHTALWAIVGLLVAVAGTKPVQAQGNLQKVKHIIVVMQENHSFDNYFGALAYAPGSPYHGPGGSEPEWFDRDGHGGCREGDHRCVDGLSRLADATGELHCFNENIDEDGHRVFAFHDSRRCVLPDLDHSWLGTHQEANFFEPNDTLRDADNYGSY